MNDRNLVKSESGGVILETALIIPFLIYVMFMGFELSRVSELQLVRRDVSRVLALTHVCAFKQGQGAQACYQTAINNVKKFTDVRFPGSLFYIQNYSIDDADYADRLSKCGSDSAKSLKIVKNSASEPTIPPKFDSKYGFRDSRVKGTIADIIPANDSQMAQQFCTNGQITIAEFNLKRNPLFSFVLDKTFFRNASNVKEFSHYEVGAV